MRRVFLLVASCFVMSLVFAHAATAQQQLTAEDFREFGTGGYGCEADQYVASAAGDPGEASLRCFDSAEAAATYSNTGQLPQTSEPQQQAQQPAQQTNQSSVLAELDERCAVFGSGFGTQLDAQEFYENNPADFALVDPNGDGQVCTAEDFTFAQEQGEQEAAATPQTPAPATQSADNEMTNLPDTGGPALLLPFAGLALMALGGLLFKRRMS